MIRGCGATSVFGIDFSILLAFGSGSCCLMLIAYFCMNFESLTAKFESLVFIRLYFLCL